MPHKNKFKLIIEYLGSIAEKGALTSCPMPVVPREASRRSAGSVAASAMG